jgi:hypothetical protein
VFCELKDSRQQGRRGGSTAVKRHLGSGN